ncbi:MAG: adenylate kinase [Candidatus Diapherotrites archaeon]|nr:adenylate kinase [Candidatus Diapherotrites archaeon]
MIYLMTGISGVGKSTVIHNCNVDLTHVNFGDIILEIAREQKLAESRDELKNIDAEKTREMQEEAVRRIKNISGKVLLDTHLTIESPYGFYPGIPLWMAKELNFKSIIIIEAPPEEVLKRRKKDEGLRARKKSDLREIELQMQLDRSFAMALSALTGVAVKIIENVDLEKASSELGELLK